MDESSEFIALYDNALRLVKETGEVSTSFIQRKLQVSYANAARIVDRMERDGLIGPPQGVRPRQIIKEIIIPQYSIAPVPTTPSPNEADETVLTEFDEAYHSAVSALPRNVRLIIERLSAQVKTQGLTVGEAALICNVDLAWLEAKITEFPIIARVFAKKELEYRMTLMKPMHAKALTDDKMAQYLLELRMPKKKSSSGEDAGDMLAAAITHIQESGDSSSLVNRSSGSASAARSVTTAIVLSRSPSASSILSRIKSLIPSNSLV